MMLKMGHHSVVRTGLRGAQEGSPDGAPQVSRCRPHGGVLIDGAKVGHDRAAYRLAVWL